MLLPTRASKRGHGTAQMLLPYTNVLKTTAAMHNANTILQDVHSWVK
jgi:hypothetical protein